METEKEKLNRVSKEIEAVLVREHLSNYFINIKAEEIDISIVLMKLSPMDFGVMLKDIAERYIYLKAITAMTIGYLCQDNFKQGEMTFLNNDSDLIRLLLTKLEIPKDILQNLNNKV